MKPPQQSRAILRNQKVSVSSFTALSDAMPLETVAPQESRMTKLRNLNHRRDKGDCPQGQRMCKGVDKSQYSLRYTCCEPDEACRWEDDGRPYCDLPKAYKQNILHNKGHSLPGDVIKQIGNYIV